MVAPHRRAAVALAGPEPPPARGLARPAGADRGGGGRRPADPGPGGAAPRRAAGRAAVLVPPLLGAPRLPRPSPARRRWPSRPRALRDPAFRDRLLARDAREADADGGGGRRRRLDRLRPPVPARRRARLRARARDERASGWPRRGASIPAALLLDLLAENDGRNFLYTPFSNYADGNLDACGEMLAHPDTVFGLGDGGAHVGLISDASFPTYVLSHWARDRAARPHGRRPGRASS